MSNLKEQLAAARKIETLGVAMRRHRNAGDIVEYIEALQEIQRINKELWGTERNDG